VKRGVRKELSYNRRSNNSIKEDKMKLNSKDYTKEYNNFNLAKSMINDKKEYIY